MKIFLSWSGERSRLVALALRDWLPMLLQNTEPWLSDRDIAAGDRWALEVGKRLEECQFGIICLTRENTIAPWVLFEAGALSKALATSAVCPYLLDVDFQEVTEPLSQFQAKKAEMSSTKELVLSINQKSAAPQPLARIEELFEVLWPKLKAKLDAIPTTTNSPAPLRSQSEVLEELVGSVRSLDHRFASFFSRVLRAQKEGSVVVRFSSEEISVDKEFLTEVESAAQFLQHAARVLGIDADGFGRDWYLADPGSQKRIATREDLQRALDTAPRILTVKHTTVPF